jgi:S-adenosylmethionine hydrolase
VGDPFEPSGVVAFLSDFGRADTYAAEVTGAMLSASPGLRVVDLTHDVLPGDVRGGAFALLRALPSFPVGTVFLAVVDPGVGTSRRAVVATTGGCALVGPDNGLLSWAAGTPDSSWHAISRDDLFRHPVSRTFHGRDVFGPVAAAIASGAIEPRRCGRVVLDPVVLPFPEGSAGPGCASGEVVAVDRFGNLILSSWALAIPRFPPDGTPVSAVIGGRRRRASWGLYASGHGLVVHEDSSGFLEIARPGGSAALATGARPGTRVVLRWRA